MKKLIMMMAAAACMLTGCQDVKTAKEKEQAKAKNTLVVYFSATGNTKKAAEVLATAADADLYRIEPTVEYTEADLDYKNEESRSSVEMKDEAARPDIKDTDPEISNYENVLIGFPIWWGVAPRVVNTFIEQHPELKGRNISIFATSGSSTIEQAEEALNNAYPKLEIKPGILMNETDEYEVGNWLEELGI